MVFPFLCFQFHCHMLNFASAIAAPKVAWSCPPLLVVLFKAGSLPFPPSCLSPVPQLRTFDPWCAATVNYDPGRIRMSTLLDSNPWFGTMSLGCGTFHWPQSMWLWPRPHLLWEFSALSQCVCPFVAKINSYYVNISMLNELTTNMSRTGAITTCCTTCMIISQLIWIVNKAIFWTMRSLLAMLTRLRGGALHCGGLLRGHENTEVLIQKVTKN